MFVNQIHQKSEKAKEKIDMENSVQKAKKSAGELGRFHLTDFTFDWFIFKGAKLESNIDEELINAANMLLFCICSAALVWTYCVVSPGLVSY